MTEKKLHERLMKYKRQHGITKEMFQQYQWALDTLAKQQSNTTTNDQEPPTP